MQSAKAEAMYRSCLLLTWKRMSGRRACEVSCSQFASCHVAVELQEIQAGAAKLAQGILVFRMALSQEVLTLVSSLTMELLRLESAPAEPASPRTSRHPLVDSLLTVTVMHNMCQLT